MLSRGWPYVFIGVMLGAGVLMAGAAHLRMQAAGQQAEVGPKQEDASPKEGVAEMDKGEKKVVRTDEEWKKLLTPEQYRIAREKATELPFTGKYYRNRETGTYYCAACGQELFTSDSKFDSGCGWPSFSSPSGDASVEERRDTSHGMVRTEVVCSRCGAHLGHVFNDGPGPTGLRYCINSGILEFHKSEPASGAERAAPGPPAESEAPAELETAAFAAGCFWGVQAAFDRLPGVVRTTVGYTGGHTEKPTYRQVCGDRTGHAEAVEVVFAPAKISYEQLLDAFWKMHDPTQVNRQGPDHGSQYRSAIFYHGEAQKKAAEASKRAFEKSGRLRRPVATEIGPAGTFWKAENYHQKYFEKHGGAACHL